MKKIQSKMKGDRVVTTLFADLSHAQGQLKSVMESCRNSKTSKLLWLTWLPARMKKIHRKMKVLEWSQCFSHYKSMKIFPNAQGQLTHKSFIRYCPILNPSKILWVSLLPARLKKIQSKMKVIVVTTLFIDLSHAQGQQTPKSVAESCRNSYPSKLLWLTLLPARMKKIH